MTQWLVCRKLIYIHYVKLTILLKLDFNICSSAMPFQSPILIKMVKFTD